METILVVDDEEGVRALARDILEMRGYTVLETGDPMHALRLLKEHRGSIHLLLTDVVMPLMNGRELAERVTTARPGIKVLFMSGFDVTGILERGSNFLPKPFKVEDLAGKVREVLDRRSPFARPPRPEAEG